MQEKHRFHIDGYGGCPVPLVRSHIQVQNDMLQMRYKIRKLYREFAGRGGVSGSDTSVGLIGHSYVYKIAV
jgi:hypothetical protein